MNFNVQKCIKNEIVIFYIYSSNTKMDGINKLIIDKLNNLNEYIAQDNEDDLILNKIIDLFLGNNKEYFVRSCTDSYNTMMENIQEIIYHDLYIPLSDDVNELDSNGTIVLFKAKDIRYVHQKYDDKQVTVAVATQHKLNYYLTIEVKYEQTIIKSEQNKVVLLTDWIEITKMPIMVGSKYCVSKRGKDIFDPLFSKEDPGGYFILRGNKRAIFFKSKVQYNEALILPNGKNVLTGDRLSISDISCHIYSKSAYTYPSFSHYLLIDYKKSVFNLTRQQMNESIQYNLFSVIKSLSDMRDVDILNYLLGDIYLCNSQEEVHSLVTISLQESNKLLKDKDIKIIRYSIAHIQDDASKVEFLLYCIRKLIRVSLKYEEMDDRDNYHKTKIMDTPGSLIEELFISYLKITKKIIKDKVKVIPEAKLNNLDILSELKLFQIDYMIKFFISTNRWGPSKKKGVCESIQSNNYLHQLETLRKIVEQEKDKNIILAKRRSRTDYQGIICSITTPTSPKIGLHKFLALFGFINEYDYRQHHIYFKALKEYIDSYVDSNVKNHYYIFFDGIIICTATIKFVQDVMLFIDNLKFNVRGKYGMLIVYYVDYKSLTLNINTHGGRLMVPVVRLKNNKLTIKYSDICKITTLEEMYEKYPGVIDYVDTYWMNHNSISLSMKEISEYNKELKVNYATNVEYQFSAVHLTPYSQFSISIALNPFASNQAAIRACYGAKQTASSITANPPSDYQSIEKTKKHLVCGTIPLTQSPFDKYVGTDKIPTTMTLFSEICSDFKNQEDAYVFNWSAIARGICVIYDIKAYEMFISFKSEEKFFKPILRQKTGNYNFSKLGADGIIGLNETVRYGDVLICKIEGKSEEYQQIKPKIEIYDQYTVGRVCKIDRYRNNQEAKEYVIVKICKTCLGEAADKVASDMGQKGVIGQIVSSSEFGHNDLNFIATVKCSPSAHTRLTAGQLIVPLVNYYAILIGNNVINNTFNNININKAKDLLEYHGFQRDFLCKMYREDSQLIMLNSVGVVPLAFKRLKQLADEGHVKKIDSGSDPITKNPIQGKTGGMKIGRMEKDALEIYGVPEFIQNVINYNTKYYICNTCKIKVDNKDLPCKLCGFKTNIIRTKIPASLGAVIDYCLPLGISIKTHVDEKTIVN